MDNYTKTGSRTFYNGTQLVVAMNWLKIQNKSEIGNRHEGLFSGFGNKYWQLKMYTGYSDKLMILK